MVFEAILAEVDQLHNISTRLEGLAEQHPPVSEALITIAGNVRGTATILAVLVATKSSRPIWSTTENLPKSKNRSTPELLLLRACLGFINRLNSVD
jgi:hypothetical protein